MSLTSRSSWSNENLKSIFTSTENWESSLWLVEWRIMTGQRFEGTGKGYSSKGNGARAPQQTRGWRLVLQVWLRWEPMDSLCCTYAQISFSLQHELCHLGVGLRDYSAHSRVIQSWHLAKCVQRQCGVRGWTTLFRCWTVEFMLHRKRTGTKRKLQVGRKWTQRDEGRRSRSRW